MRKHLVMMAGAAAVLLLAAGCQSPQGPASTSTGLNGLQQRSLTSRNIGEDLDATYNDVWYSAIATLQLNGFILKQALLDGVLSYRAFSDQIKQFAHIRFSGSLIRSSGGCFLFSHSRFVS